MIKKYKHKRTPNAQRRVFSLAVPPSTFVISFLEHILAYSWWYVDAGIEMERGNDLSLHNRAQKDIARQTKELETVIGIEWSNKAFCWALKTAKRIAPLDIEALQNLQAWLKDMRLCTTRQPISHVPCLTSSLPTTYQDRWLSHIGLYMNELKHDMGWSGTMRGKLKKQYGY